MAAPLIQASFSAGELSPFLYGRVDLNKYKIGAAKMENFVVDYKGGAAKRAGTRYVGSAPYWNGEILFIPFQFNVNQTYMLEFGHFYVRVITNGGYVLDEFGEIYEIVSQYNHLDLKLVKFTQSGDTITLVHTKYPITELVRFNHTDWRFKTVVLEPTIGTPTGVALTARSSGTIGTPVYVNYGYAATAVGGDGAEGLLSLIARLYSTLDMSAHRITMTITWNQVPSAQYYNLYKASVGVEAQIPDGVRMGFVGSTKVPTFTDSNILPNFTRPPPIHTDPFAAGQITEVIITQKGSGYDDLATIFILDPTGTGAVVKPNVAFGEIVSTTVEKGGQNYSSPTVKFSTTGALPGSGANLKAVLKVNSMGVKTDRVDRVDVLSGGTGYSVAHTKIIITDAGGKGRGAKFNPIIVGGVITGTTRISDGQDYVDPIAVATDFVTGKAEGYAVVGPRIGTYPGAVAYFQQRLLFAASENRPASLWGSKPGAFKNFDSGIPINDGDALEFTLASQQLNAIKYMIPMPGGLVILTSGGAWQLSGTQQFAPVTPTQVMATPQAFNGCGDLPPIVVGFEILFIQAAGSVVRNLSYNFFANIYTGADITVLSNHFFANHKIVSWAYAEEPDKVIWCVRDDGILLSLTFLKEQEVAGWSHHHTTGKIKAIGSVREGNRDVVYAAVERTLSTGVRFTAIEQFQGRSSRNIEESWYLDCALATVPLLGTDWLDSGPINLDPENVVFETQTVSFFLPSMVNSFIRVAGGKYQIHTVLNTTQVIAREVIKATDYFTTDETQRDHIYPQAAGTWKVSPNYSSVSGLDHLEGCLVSVMGDGKMQSDKTVVDGAITLDTPASQVLVGLGYTADLQTLRLESTPTIQARMKKIPELTIRVVDTRGLYAGTSFDTLTEVKEVAPSVVTGAPTSLYTGDLTFVMDPLWKEEGQVAIRSVNGLPANIVAVIPEGVIGDTA